MNDDEIRKRRYLSRSTIGERMKSLTGCNIPFRQVAGDAYSIADGAFLYYPATGYWRERAHSAQGYTLAGLIQAYEKWMVTPIKQEVQIIDPQRPRLPPAPAPAQEDVSEKPAGGRDSVNQQPEKTSDLDTSPAAREPHIVPEVQGFDPDAESPAGTSSLLQNKWP